MTGAIVFTGCSLFVKDDSTIFTIWTSTSCGCLASVIVAWLIDIENCRRATDRAIRNRAALLGDFYHVFDDGLQLLILRSAELSQYNEAKKWYEWIEIAYEQTDQNHELFIEIHLHIKSFLNDLSDQISIIKQQEATLLETNIIYEKDIMALSTIKTACDALNLMYNTEGLTDE